LKTQKILKQHQSCKSGSSGLLKQTVRPEFLNRIDEIVMFTPLSNENIKQIVAIQLKSVTKMLATTHYYGYERQKQ
jgi:ATP-dependent Clp protease ATP-binding subunit ClpB